MEGLQDILGLLTQFGVPVPKVVSTIGLVMVLAQFLKVRATGWMQGTNAVLIVGILGLVLSVAQFYALGLVPAVVGSAAVIVGSIGGYELVKSARTQVDADGKPIS